MTDLINSFPPISLEQMSGVKLMNRTDTKFVTTMEQLCRLLKMARQDYYIQEIDGERNLEYDTTYFDTQAFDMYNQHQWNHANRQKIRFRTYCISGLQFMEVKTKKHLRYGADTLRPVLNNHFHRITLVNKAKTERLTIDSELHFHNLVSGADKDMGNLVIIELKRDGLCYSPVLEMLRQLHIHPHGFSKYCMGSALTNQHLPIHRFKSKLREINKIMERKH